MKLFEKPWLEIIDINLNDIVATSGTDIMDAITSDEEVTGTQTGNQG